MSARIEVGENQSQLPFTIDVTRAWGRDFARKLKTASGPGRQCILVYRPAPGWGTRIQMHMTTPSFDSNVLLPLYRAAREMPSCGFPEYALRLIKPLLRFESAIWGSGITDGQSVKVRTAHLHEIDPFALAESVPNQPARQSHSDTGIATARNDPVSRADAIRRSFGLGHARLRETLWPGELPHNLPA